MFHEHTHPKRTPALWPEILNFLYFCGPSFGVLFLLKGFMDTQRYIKVYAFRTSKSSRTRGRKPRLIPNINTNANIHNMNNYNNNNNYNNYTSSSDLSDSYNDCKIDEVRRRKRKKTSKRRVVHKLVDFNDISSIINDSDFTIDSDFSISSDH